MLNCCCCCSSPCGGDYYDFNVQSFWSLSSNNNNIGWDYSTGESFTTANLYYPEVPLPIFSVDGCEGVFNIATSPIASDVYPVKGFFPINDGSDINWNRDFFNYFQALLSDLQKQIFENWYEKLDLGDFTAKSTVQVSNTLFKDFYFCVKNQKIQGVPTLYPQEDLASRIADFVVNYSCQYAYKIVLRSV